MQVGLISLVPEGYDVWIPPTAEPDLSATRMYSGWSDEPKSKAEIRLSADKDKGFLVYSANLKRARIGLAAKTRTSRRKSKRSLPCRATPANGLPLPGSIMPTALTWTDRELPGIPKGTLVFTSLKGHVYLAKDTDGDGLEDSLTAFEEGLAAPYGVLAL